MKKMKLYLGLMLLALLAIVAPPPASAAPAAPRTGSITIENPEKEGGYTAYRLFDLTLDSSNTRYGYTVNAEWNDFFTGSGAGAKYVAIDPTHGNVTLKSDTADSLRDLTQDAKKYAADRGLQGIKPTQTEPQVKFTGLELGYYLVASPAGALAALDTTNPDVSVKEKNKVPSIGKAADKTNAGIGETVHFTIKVTKGSHAWGPYVIKDTMTGLTLKPESVAVKQAGASLNQGDWSKKVKPELVAAHDLEVTINQDALNRYPDGTEFTVEYDAIANKVVEMDNTVSMDYKTDPNTDKTTPSHTVKVANYEFTIEKVDQDKASLAGATFELHKMKDCSDKAMTFSLAADGATDGVKVYRPSADGKAVIEAGKAKIEGLPAGTYYLKEIAAPDGYNKLIDPVEIKIEAQINTDSGDPFHNQAFKTVGGRVQRIDPIVTIDGSPVSAPDFKFQVVNKSGAELPSTGGMGTTMFYIAGGGMMVAAVAALAAKKRMSR